MEGGGSRVQTSVRGRILRSPQTIKLASSTTRHALHVKHHALSEKQKLGEALAHFFGYKRDVPASDSARWHVPVHPFSPFFQSWEFVSGLLLLYSCAVTPFMVAYFSAEEGFCAHPPTLAFDLVVDCFSPSRSTWWLTVFHPRVRLGG